MEVTCKDVLAQLSQSGRNRFNERQLTDLRGKQLLPPLRRDKQPGSRKPLYYWDERVVAQAAYLHDILQWDHQHHRLYLPLWLEGYDVPLRAIQRLLVRFVERHLARLTGGKTDPEEILDEVSNLISDYWLPKWKYSARTNPAIRRYGVEEWAEVIECLFDCLATPDYEPDFEILHRLFSHALSMQKEASTTSVDHPENLEETIRQVQRLLKSLSPLVSISELRNALTQASAQEWEQARSYFQKFCALANFLCMPIITRFSEEESGSIHYYLMVYGALYCLPVLLSLVCHGQEKHIDVVVSSCQGIEALLAEHGWLERPPADVLTEIEEIAHRSIEEQKQATIETRALAG